MIRLDAWSMPLAGVSLVEASAGTGKTYTIGTLCLRLVVEKDLGIGEILVVTFTNAATAELRGRLRERVREAAHAAAALASGDDETLDAVEDRPLVEWLQSLPEPRAAAARLGAAAATFDDAPISTLHGFCQRALQGFAFEIGQPFALDLDASGGKRWLREIVEDYWVRELRDRPLVFVRHLRGKIADLTDLVSLADRACEHPGAVILPREADLDVTYERRTEEYRRACVRFRGAWADVASEFVSVFSAPGFHQGQYKREQVAQHAESLKAWMAAWGGDGAVEDIPHPPPEKLKKYATDAVQKAMTKKATTPFAHPFTSAADDVLTAAAALEEALCSGVTAFRRGLVVYARSEVAARRARAGKPSFGDLVTTLAQALEGPRGPALSAALRAKYKAALVDEFQDTDPGQYGIVRAVWPKEVASSRLFLIGDPKQAIYAFRGADVFAYLAARGDARATYSMGTNWRSDPAVLRANAAIFGGHENPFFDKRIEFEDVGPRPGAEDVFEAPPAEGGSGSGLEFVFLPSDGKPQSAGEASRLATRAAAALIAAHLGVDARATNRGKGTPGATVSGAPLLPRDIAVLVRKNDQAEAMKEALSEFGVRAVLATKRLVWSTDEAEHLEHVLAAIAEPGRRGLIARALATPLFGEEASRIALVTEGDDEPDGERAREEPPLASAAWEVHAARFARWHDVWVARGFMPAFRRMLDDSHAPARLLGHPGGERTLTNLLHLAELLHTVATREHLGMASLVRFLADVRGSDDLSADRGGGDAAEIRLESDDEAVRVMTVHVAKGLEFGVVVLPYLWEKFVLRAGEDGKVKFHDPSEGDRLTIDLGSKDAKAHFQHADREERAEGQRNLYVSLTRAKHKNIVVWTRMQDAEASPLGRLLVSGSGTEGGARSLETDSKRLQALTNDEWQRIFAAKRDSSEGAIAVRTMDPPRPPPLAPVEPSPIQFVARETKRVHTAWFRTASFTALAAHDEQDPRAREDGGRAELTDERAEEVIDDAVAPSPFADDDAVSGHELLLAGFPRGPGPGQLFHDVLERIDYRGDAAHVASVAAAIFPRYGVESTQLGLFSRGLRAAVRTPFALPGGGGTMRLSDLAFDERRHELEFLLPVAGPKKRSAAGVARLTPDRLARPFRDHPSAEVGLRYARRLERLRFLPLEGYLRGFVDLVFVRDGKTYLVDFKSTHLGARPEGYAPARLRDAMEEAHYPLQYHLYALALHRALAQRQPGYEYDAHFGGIIYLFLRGMTEEGGRAEGTNGADGVFVEKPPHERILALSALFAGEG